MNTSKNIRKRTMKVRIAHDNATLDMLRFVGIKRRHAFLRSCRKNMDKKGLHTEETARALRHEIRDSLMYKQMTGASTLKKRYEKPMIIMHDADLVPSLRCKLCL